MGLLKCSSVTVAVVALLGPAIFSVLFDGRVWDLLPGWRPSNMPDMTGKVAIVTGPTVNGIGHESCVELCRKGAHVILAGRSREKGEEGLRVLKKRVPNAQAEFMELDLAKLSSVRAFVDNFKAKGLRLHILMNSAGVMANSFSLTADGLESQFATNHLGHFLLTKLLLPVLEESAPSRIVTVSSAAAFFPEMLKKFEMFGVDAAPAIDFDHLGTDYNETYSPWSAYGRSKLANVLFTQALSRRLVEKRIYANVCHPGGIKTNLARHVEDRAHESFGGSFVRFLQAFQNMILMSPSQGAVTQLYLATSSDVEEMDIRGKYYRPQAIMADPPSAATEELQEKLWSISEELVTAFL